MQDKDEKIAPIRELYAISLENNMNRKMIYRTLLSVAVLNIIALLFFIFTTEQAYVVATIPETYFQLILIYIPFALTILPTAFFAYDLAISRQKNWIWFFISFMGILPDAIFVIGSYYFGKH